MSKREFGASESVERIKFFAECFHRKFEQGVDYTRLHGIIAVGEPFAASKDILVD